MKDAAGLLCLIFHRQGFGRGHPKPMMLLGSGSLIDLKEFIRRQVLVKRLPDYNAASSMPLMFRFWGQGGVCCSEEALDPCCAA
jgi:hypothetical protein